MRRDHELLLPRHSIWAKWPSPPRPADASSRPDFCVSTSPDCTPFCWCELLFLLCVRLFTSRAALRAERATATGGGQGLLLPGAAPVRCRQRGSTSQPAVRNRRFGRATRHTHAAAALHTRSARRRPRLPAPSCAALPLPAARRPRAWPVPPTRLPPTRLPPTCARPRSLLTSATQVGGRLLRQAASRLSALPLPR